MNVLELTKDNKYAVWEDGRIMIERQNLVTNKWERVYLTKEDVNETVKFIEKQDN